MSTEFYKDFYIFHKDFVLMQGKPHLHVMLDGKLTIEELSCIVQELTSTLNYWQIAESQKDYPCVSFEVRSNHKNTP